MALKLNLVKRLILLDDGAMALGDGFQLTPFHKVVIKPFTP